MARNTLIDRLVEKRPDIQGKIDNETVDRILTKPQQESLAEAVAADLVDAAPVIGDLLALERRERAMEMGQEYPVRPAFLENALSDLPPPLDTAGDLLVSQNVIKYFEEKSG